MPDVLRSDRGRFYLLLAIVGALAAALRFADLGNAPPGLQQDEACNAWNAWCLLKTGRDQSGAPWPLLYAQALGENRSTLFFYWTIPFQLLGGMNVWTTRAPAAVAGVLTVLLTAYVGARLFDRRIGLLAAAFLALCPWHIQHTRWGHEAALGPLAVAATLALALASGFPLIRMRRDGDESDLPGGLPRGARGDIRDAGLAGFTAAPIPPRPILAGVAGLITAALCYGYPAIRIYVPSLMLVILALTLPNWRGFLRSRRAAAALGAYVVVGLSAFAPLLWAHLAHPAEIARRAERWVWSAEDGPVGRVLAVAQRYVAHFSPDFLYLRGDAYEAVASPTGAYLPWYSAPLLLIGALVLALRVPWSAAARVTLAALLLYPIGDAFVAGKSAHALRSFPGVVALSLVAAVGAATLWQWIRRRSLRASLSCAAALGLIALAEHANHGYRLFGEFNRREVVYHGYQVDLLEACRWLRPRMAGIDTVVVSPNRLNMPYIISLVALGYEPANWLQRGGQFQADGIWNQCFAYDKFIFTFPGAGFQAVAPAWERRGRGQFYTISRPGELPGGVVDYVVRDSRGVAQLKIQRQSGDVASAAHIP